jgi:hypothetical protein
MFSHTRGAVHGQSKRRTTRIASPVRNHLEADWDFRSWTARTGQLTDTCVLEVLRKEGILMGYGMKLPALTKRARPSAFPAILTLLSKNLFLSGVEHELGPKQMHTPSTAYTSQILLTAQINLRLYR